MKVKLVNMLKRFKDGKFIFITPNISYVNDGFGSGIWVCWLHLGLWIGMYK